MSEKKIKYSVGIDFGTTNSAVTVSVNGRLHELTILGNGPQLPSVVWWEPGQEPVVGANAMRSAYKYPEYLYTHFKRLMPTAPREPIGGPDGPTPIMLMAEILKHLLAVICKAEPEIKQHLDSALPREELVIMVTHPADSGTPVHDAYREAAKLAGFEIDGFVSEAVAAVKRVLEENEHRIKHGDYILLADIGGGTTDISIYKFDLTSGELNAIAAGGNSQVGGEDITALIFQRFAKQLNLEIADCFAAGRGLDLLHSSLTTPAQRQKAFALWKVSREAKELLSISDTATVYFETSSGPEELTLTTAEYDEITKPIWGKVEAAAADVIATSNLDCSDIQIAVLAGGSAMARCAVETIATVSKRALEQVLVSSDSTHVVASGAAIAGRRSDNADSNLPRGFGYRVRAGQNGHYKNRMLLGTNTIVEAGGSTVQNHDQYLISNGGLTTLVLQFVEAAPAVVVPQPVDGVPTLLDDPETVRLQQVVVRANIPAGKHDVLIAVTIDQGIPGFHLSFPGLPQIESISGRLSTDESGNDELIESPPLDIFLLLDTSSSMRGEKLKQAKLAVQNFLQQTQKTDARLCLVSFGHRTGVVAPLGSTTKELKRELKDVKSEGGTPMTKAFNCGTDQLRRHARDGARLVSLLLTDGHPADPMGAESAARTHKERAELLCIGVGEDVNESYLLRLASNGQYFHAADAGQIECVFQTATELILK